MADEHPFRDFAQAIVNAFFLKPQVLGRDGWPRRFHLWKKTR